MAHYKTLKAWQHAQRLAIECVRASRGFPDYEQHALADQLRRAFYSVPLNIAEGNTRQGSREYRRFLGTARGARCEEGASFQVSPAAGCSGASGAWGRGELGGEEGTSPF